MVGSVNRMDCPHRCTSSRGLGWHVEAWIPQASKDVHALRALSEQRRTSQSRPPENVVTVQVLVASDAMTRGMDVEGVAQVLNYDAPVYAKTYVHRCGRTARAGHAGRAFTLLRKQACLTD